MTFRRSLGSAAAVALLSVLTPADSTSQRSGVTEVWRVGSLDAGPTAFGRIVDVAADRRGTLYVLDALNFAVKLVSADGRFLGEFGREGNGPGEFRRPAALGFSGPLLWVFDPGRQDVQFFEGDSLTEVTRVPALDLDGDGRSASLTVAGVGPDPRRYLVMPFVDAYRIVHGLETQGITAGIDQPFASVDTIVVRNFRNSMGHVPPLGQEDSRGGFFFRQPFGDDDIQRIDSRGERVLVVTRGPDGSAGYRVLTNRGRTVAEGGVPWTGPRLSRAYWNAALDEALAPWLARLPSFLNAQNEPQLRRMFEDAMYRPEHVPAVVGAMLGGDGSVWLAVPVRPAVSEWRRIEPESGRVLAAIELPSDTRVLEADEDGLIAERQGEFDEQYLVRFEQP